MSRAYGSFLHFFPGAYTGRAESAALSAAQTAAHWRLWLEKNSDVKWPDDSSIEYLPETDRLRVGNWRRYLDRIAKRLAKANKSRND